MMFYKETAFKETSIGKIPKEWELRSLKDVVASCENGVWGDEPSSNDDSYPVIRSTEITHDGKIDISSVARRKIPKEIVERYALEDGDILVVGSSGSAHLIGRTALFLNPDNEKYLFSNFMIRIRPRNIHPHFLYYFLNSENYFVFLTRLQQTSTGLRNLPKKEFLKFNVPFPALPEQRAVAGVLGVVDSVIAKTGEVIAKTERLKKGLMQTLLTRGIGHKKYKQTPIGTTPKTWQIVRLGEVLELCQYGLSARFGDRGKYHILKMDDIVDGVAIPDNAKYIDLDERTFENFKLEKGDILFNRTNSYELVGRTGIFLLDGDYTFASYLIRLRPKKEIVDSLFLTYYMIFSNNRLRQLATRAVHQANINATNLQSFTISIPPLSEQKKIAETLMTLDKKLEFERKEKAKLERIKQGLMDLLLTGKVRVKVD